MNMRTLLLSLLFFGAGFIQCDNEKASTPLDQQEENYNAFLQWYNLKKNIDNSIEQQNFDNAQSEHEKYSIAFQQAIQQCSKLNNCSISSEFISAFFAYNKSQSELNQKWLNLQNSEAQQELTALQTKYQ